MRTDGPSHFALISAQRKKTGLEQSNRHLALEQRFVVYTSSVWSSVNIGFKQPWRRLFGFFFEFTAYDTLRALPIPEGQLRGKVAEDRIFWLRFRKRGGADCPQRVLGYGGSVSLRGKFRHVLNF